MRTRFRFAALAWSATVLSAGALWPVYGNAAIFGDDEARKAIIDLRQKVDADQRAAESARKAFETESRESAESTRRSLLELSNQLEQLRAEIARLRGQNEQLTRDVSELQRMQKDAQAGIDQRLKQVEPLQVTHDGASFSAEPAEKRDFDAALEMLRASDFDGAGKAFAAFVRRYPASGYLPSALYWQGNAQYATRDYKNSIASHQRLISQYPANLRTPEAMLAMANSQIELKDTRTARRTLEQLIKLHPESEAAAAGRDRLSRLR
jgi:tol-pal system protein YbgF